MCPLVLVHDDRPGFALSDDVQQQLRQSYGSNSIFPLTHLISRVSASSNTSEHVVRGASARSMLKLYLWALPPERFKRVVLLDLDLLILNNIDHLLDRSMFEGKLLAAGCGKRTQSGKHEYFNTGVVVFEPRMAFASWSLGLARFSAAPWRGRIGIGRWIDECAAPGCTQSGPFTCAYLTHFSDILRANGSALAFRACMTAHRGKIVISPMIKACEPSYTDQSIINKAVYRSWGSLPPRFNYGWHTSQGVPAPGIWRHHDIVHFVAAPKPWTNISTLQHASKSLIWAVRSLGRVWAEACSAYGGGPLLSEATNTTLVSVCGSSYTKSCATVKSLT